MLHIAAPARPFQNLLDPLKEFAGNQRRVLALVDLPAEPEKADIKGISQDVADLACRQGLVAHPAKTPARYRLGKARVGVGARCVGIEHLADEQGAVFVDNDGPRLLVVAVSRRRHVRIDALAQFLAESAPDVLGKIVHIVFRLPEGDGEHELALGRVLEPKSGKLQGGYLASVEGVDDPPAVYRIPCQSVGVPSQNPLRFAFLHRRQHFVEDGPPRLFRRLRLDVFVDDLKPFLRRQHAQLVQLRLN